MLKKLVFISMFFTGILSTIPKTEAGIMYAFLGIWHSSPKPNNTSKPLNNIFRILPGDLKIEFRTKRKVKIDGGTYSTGYLDFIPKDQYRLTLNRRMGYEYFVSHPSMKFILTGQANGLNELLNALHKKHPEGLYFAWSDLERFLKEARTAGDNEFADNFIKLFRKKDDLESPLYKEQTCRAVVASLRDSTTL